MHFQSSGEFCPREPWVVRCCRTFCRTAHRRSSDSSRVLTWCEASEKKTKTNWTLLFCLRVWRQCHTKKLNGKCWIWTIKFFTPKCSRKFTHVHKLCNRSDNHNRKYGYGFCTNSDSIKFEQLNKNLPVVSCRKSLFHIADKGAWQFFYEAGFCGPSDFACT